VLLAAAFLFVLGGVAGILLVAGEPPPPAPVIATHEPDDPLPISSPVPSPSPLGLPVLPSPIPAAPTRMFGLALPAKAPANERAPGPVVMIGRIRIPSIGLVHPVYEGVTLTVVDHGPGHWPGSAMPGDRGNSVFAGHRVTNSRPFYDLDLVEVGDKVILEVGGGPRPTRWPATSSSMPARRASRSPLPARP
jgi:hypothetical protein